MSEPKSWDDAYDIVIVGSGAAGLTAGIIAARRGLKPLVIEKASVWGGTSALSLGGVWVPANQLMLKAGCKDSKDDAIQFLRNVVPPRVSRPHRTGRPPSSKTHPDGRCADRCGYGLGSRAESPRL